MERGKNIVSENTELPWASLLFPAPRSSLHFLPSVFFVASDTNQLTSHQANSSWVCNALTSQVWWQSSELSAKGCHFLCRADCLLQPGRCCLWETAGPSAAAGRRWRARWRGLSATLSQGEWRVLHISKRGLFPGIRIVLAPNRHSVSSS